MSDPNPRSSDGLRNFNRDRVLAALASAGALTRADLASATGLARSTITDLVAELLRDERIAVDQDPGPGRQHAGRPSQRLVPAPNPDLVLGVDFGHSHCRAGIVDALGTVLASRAAELDVDASPGNALHEARDMIGALLDEVGPLRNRVVGAVMGLPAPVDTTLRTVGPGNVLPKWVSRLPADELQAMLGLPVLIENDANLGALGEMAFGAARGLTDVIYVKASAGIGAGLVLGGRLYRGSTGRAGEIGHVPVDPSGSVCRCGNRGCLESVASMTRVLSIVQTAHRTPMTGLRLTELLDAGDAGARRVVTDAGRMIGRVVADLVNNLNPQIVVLGGELAWAGTPLLAGVQESIDRYAQPDVAGELRVRLGALGPTAQLLGARALFFANAPSR